MSSHNSKYCALFESNFYRPSLCVHCFRVRSDHVVNTTNTDNRITNSSGGNKVDISTIKRAPNSIRRSLTPQAIHIFSQEFFTPPPIDSISNKEENYQRSLPVTPPLAKNSSASSSSKLLSTSPDSSYKRPLPPLPNTSPNNSTGKSLKSSSTLSTPSQSPLSSSPTTSTSSLSSFALEENNKDTNNQSNSMIDISFITRQNRSHSDTASSAEKPPVPQSSGSSLAINHSSSASNTPSTSTPSLSSPKLNTKKNHSKSNSSGDKFDSGIIHANNGQFSGSLQFSSSPSLSSSSNSTTPPITSINSSSGKIPPPHPHSAIFQKNTLSASDLSSSPGLGGLPPNSPSGRKYTNIAKSFIKLKLNRKQSGSKPGDKLSTLPSLQLYNDDNIEPQNRIFYSIQSIVSAMPGMSTNSVYAIMDILNSQSLDIDYNSVVSDENLVNLKKASKTLDQWIESQERVRQIIKVQSYIRRFLAKKRFEWLNEVYNKTILRERNIAFRQLVNFEKKYNENLKLIIDHYYNPLKQQNLIPDMDFRSIFASINEIFLVHHRILHQFKQLHRKWPSIEGLGEFFLRIAPELKVYGEYVKNFKNAIDTLNRCQDEYPKFANFLKEQQEQTPGKVLDLMALIATPLNHLSVYERQLTLVANNTPPNWVDYHNINNAVIMMKEVEQSVQENLALSQNASTLMNIYRKISNKKALDHFVKTGRQFIHEGKLIKVDPKKKDQVYYYNLCNDVILFVKKTPNNKEVLNFKNIFNLSDVIVNDLPDQPNHKNIISIQNIKLNENYTFSIEDKNEKNSLIKQFSKLCTTNKSTKIFGISLADLLQRDGYSIESIPIFIIKICEILLGQVHLEGLFRISPNQSDVDVYKEAINKAKDTDSALDSILSKIPSGHVLAALLKTYLRELSPPLLTFDLFDKVVELGDKDLSGADLITQIKPLLQSIPLANQNTLHLLLKTLQFVATNSEVNKMTHSNLAIVFGPNLLKPEHQTIESSLKIPIINNVIASLLDSYNLLYNNNNDFIKINSNQRFEINGKTIETNGVGGGGVSTPSKPSINSFSTS